jgi:ParB family chromosome partitioning protein
MNQINWSTRKEKINSLIPADYNPRKISEHDLEKLKESINRFNDADPIIVNKNLNVIGGHQRIKAMAALGIVDVDVRVPDRDLTEEEEKELNLRLNRNTGEFAFDMLGVFGKEMLVDVGFSDEEMDKIFPVIEDEKDDEVPDVPDTPVSVRGDIYLLGNHRVMCGDSTNVDDVELLMDGKKADLLFTSPPYNVGDNSLGGNKNMTDSKYQNDSDNKTHEEYLTLLHKFYSAFSPFCRYLFINIQMLSGNKKSVIEFIHQHIDFFVDVCVWNKGGGQPAMAKNVLNSRFEFIFIFKNENNPNRSIDTANFHGNISNVFTLNPSGKNEFSLIHSAVFPVEFASHWMQFARRNEIVCDPFCGVGTSIIAAEKTGRYCYGMEIDPKYTDVIVKRYCDYVGSYEVIRNGEKIQWQDQSQI